MSGFFDDWDFGPIIPIYCIRPCEMEDLCASKPSKVKPHYLDKPTCKMHCTTTCQSLSDFTPTSAQNTKTTTLSSFFMLWWATLQPDRQDDITCDYDFLPRQNNQLDWLLRPLSRARMLAGSTRGQRACSRWRRKEEIKKYVRATKSRKLYPPDHLKGQSHDLADRALSWVGCSCEGGIRNHM